MLLGSRMAHPIVAGLVAQEQLDPVQRCYERGDTRPLQLVSLPLGLLGAEGVAYTVSGFRMCNALTRDSICIPNAGFPDAVCVRCLAVMAEDHNTKFRTLVGHTAEGTLRSPAAMHDPGPRVQHSQPSQPVSYLPCNQQLYVFHLYIGACFVKTDELRSALRACQQAGQLRVLLVDEGHDERRPPHHPPRQRHPPVGPRAQHRAAAGGRVESMMLIKTPKWHGTAVGQDSPWPCLRSRLHGALLGW